MSVTIFTVAREGKLWGVSSRGETLAVSRTKRGATDLAKASAGILSASGSTAEVTVAGEPRSFAEARDPTEPDPGAAGAARQKPSDSAETKG